MRKPRNKILNYTGIFHKMWRGHNKEFVLDNYKDKYKYLTFLSSAKSKEISKSIKWFSFCIMGNHVHESGKIICDNPEKSFNQGIKIFGNWMRNAHSRYGMYYNKKYERQGKVSYDRPKTQEVEDQHGLMRLMFYMDCNPVMAGIVKHPTEYKYSSCRFYAYGDVNDFTKHLDLPNWYMELGNTARKRQKKYRKLLDAYMRENEMLKDKKELFESIFIGRQLWRETRARIFKEQTKKVKSMLSVNDNRAGPVIE